MSKVNWDTRPHDKDGNQHKHVLTGDIKRHRFDEPLHNNDLVELQATIQQKPHRVRVRVADPTDPNNVAGTVDLSADPSAIRALDLAHYDNVAFSRDQIFVRVFED